MMCSWSFRICQRNSMESHYVHTLPRMNIEQSHKLSCAVRNKSVLKINPKTFCISHNKWRWQYGHNFIITLHKSCTQLDVGVTTPLRNIYLCLTLSFFLSFQWLISPLWNQKGGTFTPVITKESFTILKRLVTPFSHVHLWQILS